MLLLSFIAVAVSEPEQHKHQSYKNEEVRRSKVPVVTENQVSFQNVIVCLL